LERLRNAGNTVVVVEHEASVMRAADQIVDLGPGHGATGGSVVFQGSYQEILKSGQSLTGKYLSGRKQVPLPKRRGVHSPRRRGGELECWSDEAHHSTTRSLRSVSYKTRDENSSAWALNDAPASLDRLAHFPDERNRQNDGPALKLQHITRHNLKDLTVEIPLERFVCVTGVSGSGKTTLIREVLFPALAAKLQSESPGIKASDRLSVSTNGGDEGDDSTLDPRPSTLLQGSEHVGQVVLVDQSILGKTPRSNPAVYIGAFDDIRELFAQSEAAKQRGLNASAFSFNSGQGQCERCRGAGFEKIEMQFLSDVFVRCPDCNGRRYRPHILEVKLRPPMLHAPGSLSIADLLDSTVDEALEFLAAFPDSRPAKRAREKLALLQEVGLGYLKLGQPINTLSGGESQRLKLVRHLADSFGVHPLGCQSAESGGQNTLKGGHRTLFLFDEPTTGLHFDDVRLLIAVFQRLGDAGHSVVVIEHNLDLIKCADWIIDLGPEAGDGGGRIVAEGTPEDIACAIGSHTGTALREQGAGSRVEGRKLKGGDWA
jgi:excinuclease ABC subunit A